jgi:Gas vesicle protein G
VFLLDSLMISGLRWVMNTVVTAAEAEMNDDTALREQLLDAEMRREMGELSDEEFQEIEADVLTRIREIKERREGGSAPLSMGAAPIETTADSRFQIEASVSGDFHEPAGAPHTTIIETEPRGGEQITVLDMEPGQTRRRKPPASRRKLRRS